MLRVSRSHTGVSQSRAACRWNRPVKSESYKSHIGVRVTLGVSQSYTGVSRSHVEVSQSRTGCHCRVSHIGARVSWESAIV